MNDNQKQRAPWSEEQISEQCDLGRSSDPALAQFVDKLQSTETVEPSDLLKARILAELGAEAVTHPQPHRALRAMLPLAALLMLALGLWTIGQNRQPASNEVRIAHVRGLDWLVAQQQADGHWQPTALGGNAQFTPGVTALSLMALLQSEKASQYRDATHRATAYLTQFLGDAPAKANQAFSYNHSLATLALLESYAISPDDRMHDVIDRALGDMLKQQSASGGWGYQASTGLEYGASAPPNSAISVWPLAVLSRAKELGWLQSSSADTKCKQWLASLIDNDGLIGYRSKGDFPHGPSTLLAMGLTCLNEEVPHIAQNLDQLNPQSRDMYELFFTARALEKNAAHELKNLQANLVQQQVEDGSWDSEGSWSLAGGKVYATAMASLSLGMR